MSKVPKNILQQVIVFFTYILFAVIGIVFSYEGTNATPIWFSSGIALGFILLYGYSVWPSIFLAAIMVNFFFFSTSPNSWNRILFFSLFVSIGNTLEAVIGYYLIQRFLQLKNLFLTVKNTFRFILIIGFLSTTISALMGSISLCLLHDSWSNFDLLFSNWWLDDLLGIILITPIFIKWKWKNILSFRTAKYIEILFFTIFLGIFVFFIAKTNYPIKFILFPVLLWSVFRFGDFETTVIIVLICLFAILLNSTIIVEPGTFIKVKSLLVFQMFFGVLTITFLLLNALLKEKETLSNEIKQNRNLIQDIIDNSNSLIWALSKQKQFILFNKQFLKMLNLSAENLIGMKPNELNISNSFNDLFNDNINKTDIQEIAIQDNDDAFYFILQQFPLKTKLNEVYANCFIATDITQQKLNAQKIEETNKDLEFLNKIILSSASVIDLSEMLNIIIDEALKITQLEGGTICLIQDGYLELITERNVSVATKKDLSENKLKVGECLCGNCALTQKPLILKTRQEVIEYASREVIRNEDIRFHAAYPILSKEKTLGVLCVFTNTDFKPAERSIKILETITMQIGMAIENAQLFEKIKLHSVNLEEIVHDRTNELEKLNNDLVNSMEEQNTLIEELDEANKELSRLNDLFVGREFRIKELRIEIEELKKRINND